MPLVIKCHINSIRNHHHLTKKEIKNLNFLESSIKSVIIRYIHTRSFIKLIAVNSYLGDMVLYTKNRSLHMNVADSYARCVFLKENTTLQNTLAVI